MFKISMIRRSVAMAVTLACVATAAHADERESLETLKQTTMGLIEALVEQGVLPRAKADAMLAAAQQKAAAVRASAPPVAEAKPGTIRVPYVPQAVKDQLRNEIREEVATQARAERWGVPNSAAGWTDRIKIEGDIRVRHQSDFFDKSNTAASVYDSDILASGGTRAVDFANFTSSGFLNSNLTESRNRLRLRARLDVTAKVSDQVSTGIRIATGSSTDRVSTNQTMGQDFNKYTLLLDRAFIRYEPVEWLNVSAGRIPNPWFNSEMMWSDNLNFEGLAVQATWPSADTSRTFTPFATAGIFPLREDAPPTRGDRWLYGAQVGGNWQLNASTQIKLGIAQYKYQNMEGQIDQDYTLNQGAGLTYGQYEYGRSLRQKGNTLFLTNNSLDGTEAEYYGLASKFAPLAITAAARFSHFSPYSLLTTFEYVTNTAYDEAEIKRRTALASIDGRKDGYILKAAFGHPLVQQRGDWQVSASYRAIGADAVLDAFTDSDLGLGGTNLTGFTLGFQYGIDRNTNVNVRYLSGRELDPFTIGQNSRFSVDTLQVDFNVRF